VYFGSRTSAVELPGDLLTPFGVFCLLDQQQEPGGDAFLFEGALGRYSYVGVGGGGGAAARLTVRGGQACGSRSFGLRLPDNPLEAIRAVLDSVAAPRTDELPPFCGGLAGYLGWGAARFSERIPERLGPDPLFPEADLLFVRELVAFDHRQGRCWAVASGSGDGKDAPEARARALADRVLRIFVSGAGKGESPLVWPQALCVPAASPLRGMPAGTGGTGGAGSRAGKGTSAGKRGLSGGLLTPVPLGGGKRAFIRGVKRALEYIRAGDLFQVVLSQRFELPDCDGFSLYRTLRAASPAPYHFYLRLGGRELFGASPELLVQVENGEMTVRPIAGTRRRGETAAEDARLEAELRADPKERAEHVMLVDLGRNDVGRVAEIGSVRVARLMETERFSHVMHMTSEVTGRLRRGLGAVDAFAAAFPAGTLSGAPKIRALEIIDELETVSRGPYGGAVGWFSAAGDVQLAIAIRTLFRSGNRLFAQAGAGIVADSDPETEWREVLAKVRASMGAASGAAAEAAAAARAGPSAGPSREGALR
jgi:anthranilate synthase component I